MLINRHAKEGAGLRPISPMSMTYSEAGKLSAASRKEREAKINEYAEQFRPKVLGTKKENGVKITVIAPGYAIGVNDVQYIKRTSSLRNRGYEL